MAQYATEPLLDERERWHWRTVPAESGDETMLRPVATPFLPDGGMRLVQGNLGRGTFKTSAVDPERWTIEAPARVFERQEEVAAAFKAGELDRDVVVVVRFQGPRANGMPELHKLTPPLGVLQDRGFKVALVTDGRMSGASGKVPGGDPRHPRGAGRRPAGAAARRRCGAALRRDGRARTCSPNWPAANPPRRRARRRGMGRELFAMFRHGADGAEQGGSAMLELAGSMSAELVAVDIGGTHARFALASVSARGARSRWASPSRCAPADHRQPAERLGGVRAAPCGEPLPAAAAIAIAGAGDRRR